MRIRSCISEFISIISILNYAFIEFIILLYRFLVPFFSRYKEYMICRISFCKFSDVLRAFTCTRAIGNLQSICLGVNILIPFSCVGFNENTTVLKALRVNLWH